MEIDTAIAEFKYPKEEGYRLYWVFDQSSCHTAFSDDALNASRMNMKPGGGQPKMWDTVYQGKLQRMVFEDGTPKGAKRVLEERGINTRGMKLDDMREELSRHADFKDEKTLLEHFLHNKGHACLFLPKFHCKLNPIERCWGQAKHFTRAHTNYTIQGLRKTVTL